VWKSFANSLQQPAERVKIPERLQDENMVRSWRCAGYIL
jgi:hypothetical protein